MTPPSAFDIVPNRWGFSFVERTFGAVLGLARQSPSSSMMDREVALISRVEGLVQRLEHEFNVVVQDTDTVKDYLVRFPDTHARMLYLVRLLRNGFGPMARFVLDMNRDPEIDNEFLVLVVRMPLYDEQTYGRIRTIRQVVDRVLPEGEGRVLATTDFR
jgi:hypothetical protein